MLSRSAVKTTASKPISKLAKDFGVLKNLNATDNLISSENIVTTLKSNSTRASFSFSFSVEEDVFCCGIRTVGHFNTTSSNSPEISEKDKISFIKEALEMMLENSTKRSGSHLTFMFSLINNTPCNMIKKAISDGELFTLVKTFTNANSGNKNELYISN